MESLTLMAVFIRREVILEYVTNLTPFLNIREFDGIYYYRFIIILKMLFANYATTFAIPKYLTIFLLFVGNGYVCHMSPALTLPWFFIGFISILIYAFPGMSNRFEIPSLLMCVLSMNIKPYEFLLDMLTSFCFAWYALQAYAREIQKASTIVFLMLAIGWFISINEDHGYVNPINYSVPLIGFLIVMYLPLRPNPNSKNRHRLLYFYAVMFLWILYKIHHVGYIEKVAPAPEISIVKLEPRYDIGDEVCTVKKMDLFKSAVVESVGIKQVKQGVHIPREVYAESIGEITECIGKSSQESPMRLEDIKYFGPTIHESDLNKDSEEIEALRDEFI